MYADSSGARLPSLRFIPEGLHCMQWASEVSCLPTRGQHRETLSIRFPSLYCLHYAIGCCVHHIARVEVVIVFQLTKH